MAEYGICIWVEIYQNYGPICNQSIQWGKQYHFTNIQKKTTMLMTSNSSDVAIIIREKQLADEHMKDVELLLENMFQREEATLQLVIDRLYDIGSNNLINYRVKPRRLNRLMKWIARLTKPAFHYLAVRWSKKNCPKLIATWLYSQVQFPKTELGEELIAAYESTPSE